MDVRNRVGRCDVTFRRIGDPFGRHPQCVRNTTAARQHIGEYMGRRVLQFQFSILRHLAVPAFAMLLGVSGASAQSNNDNHGQDQKQQAPNPADVSKENQRKTDEFVEAAQALNGGPAGNPECVWLGRRVVLLMYNDDLDTAFRHLDLYDRFGCPGGHVQAAFRCLTRFGGQIDPKIAETLSSRIHACWINPGAQPQQAAAASPAPAAPATAGNAAPAPAPTGPPRAPPPRRPPRQPRPPPPPPPRGLPRRPPPPRRLRPPLPPHRPSNGPANDPARLGTVDLFDGSNCRALKTPRRHI